MGQMTCSPVVRLHAVGRRRSIIGLSVACGLAVACSACQSRSTTTSGRGNQPPSAGLQLTPELVRQHNRGVALMGQFDFGKAHQIFAKLVEEHPEWTEAQVDLAISALNRQQPEDEKQAAMMLERVLARQPNHLRAKYCRALLHFHAGQAAEALPLFRHVAQADPKDSYAAFHVGQCLLQMSRTEEALDQFLLAQRIDPYLRSAYYGAFQAAQRLGRADEAQQQLDQFQKLATNPQARLAEMKYTRMGPKAEARPIPLDQPEHVIRPTGPVFSQAEPLNIRGTEGYRWRSYVESEAPPCRPVCDMDGDGQVDLFLAAALEANNGRLNAVLVRRNDGFELDPKHELAQVADVNAALWGDYDNDGLTDVYLCRRGPNQLWRQIERNTWQDVTEGTNTSGGNANTVDGAMFDADHDGDLDLLLVNEDVPNELLTNNLDGTFRAIAQSQGLAGDGRPSRGVVVADLDSDRDVDLVIIKQEPPHEVFLNDRFWSYRPADGSFDTFRQAPIVAALPVDSGTDGPAPEQITEGDWFDIEASAAWSGVDGQVELMTLSAGGVVRWAPDKSGTWLPHPLSPQSNVTSMSGPLAIQDVDGDGRLDLVCSTGEDWTVMNVRGKPATLFQSQAARLRHWTFGVLDARRGPALIGLRSAEPPLIWHPGSGRYAFAALSFTGREDKADQMRSNASGIGIKFAVRVNSRSTALDTYRKHSGPGQSLEPVAVGLGLAKQIDFVSITWPDGVYQTEVDLEAGVTHRIDETQRQVSSCPVVFVWNGQKYEFVTDVLGVGGIGFNVGAGDFAQPRPWENLLLPESVLVAKDGKYQVKITEPMEEACYLDAARLVAYDLPPGWRMTLDERWAATEPWPTGKPVLYRQSLAPIEATNDRNENVTDRILRADLRAADPGKPDRRFIGRTDEHTVTLTFENEKPLDRLAGEPVLICGGWIEYPYSQTMFGAWQAAAGYDAPTVEVRGADGGWHVLLGHFGYMAGMPRQMSVPLPKERLPSGTTQLRLRTNMEIYWDHFAVASAENCESMIRRQLPLRSAVVDEVGFAERTTLPQRLPRYNYDRRVPLWDTWHPAGFYTRFGPVTPLVNDTDDAVAIIGPGEEVHLDFDAAVDELRPAWTRRFVLETNGWCKDSDLHTQNAGTLDPVPRRAGHVPAEASRRADLHRSYNTRFRSGP